MGGYTRGVILAGGMFEILSKHKRNNLLFSIVTTILGTVVFLWTVIEMIGMVTKLRFPV
jgi:hypothetical protein